MPAGGSVLRLCASARYSAHYLQGDWHAGHQGGVAATEHSTAGSSPPAAAAPQKGMRHNVFLPRAATHTRLLGHQLLRTDRTPAVAAIPAVKHSSHCQVLWCSSVQYHACVTLVACHAGGSNCTHTCTPCGTSMAASFVVPGVVYPHRSPS
jgi:hypothetical protein